MRSVVHTEPAAGRRRPEEIPTLTFTVGSGAAEADASKTTATRLAAESIRVMYYNLVANLEQPCTKLATTGPPTILFEVFWTQQKRKRLIEVALAGVDLPPEDYPFYVTIGADGPADADPDGRDPRHAALDGRLPGPAARAPWPR